MDSATARALTEEFKTICVLGLDPTSLGERLNDVPTKLWGFWFHCRYIDFRRDYSPRVVRDVITSDLLPPRERRTALKLFGEAYLIKKRRREGSDKKPSPEAVARAWFDQRSILRAARYYLQKIFSAVDRRYERQPTPPPSWNTVDALGIMRAKRLTDVVLPRGFDAWSSDFAAKIGRKLSDGALVVSIQSFPEPGYYRIRVIAAPCRKGIDPEYEFAATISSRGIQPVDLPKLRFEHRITTTPAAQIAAGFMRPEDFGD